MKNAGRRRDAESADALREANAEEFRRAVGRLCRAGLSDRKIGELLRRRRRTVAEAREAVGMAPNSEGEGEP
jgi:hypothetical protein